MSDFSHLSEVVEEQQSEDSLKRLTELAKDYKAAQTALQEAEEAAKEAKKAFNKLSQELIPEAMTKVGMSAFNLETGETVSFKEDLSASVKDYDKFYNFLNERGDGSLMKIVIEVGKIPKEILAKIIKELYMTYDIDASSELFIHPMTLKSYLKKLCGIGGTTKAEMALAELDEDMVSTYTFYKTTVK